MTVLNIIWFVAGMGIGAAITYSLTTPFTQCERCGAVVDGACPHCYELRPEIRPLRAQQETSPIEESVGGDA